MRTTATVAIAIALVVIGKAHAADMSPIPAGPSVAPPVTYGSYAPNAYGNYNWSGIYLGGNGGYSWNEGGSSFLVSNTGLTGGLGNLAGWVFGGQIGYNWQFGAFVTGLEGDLQWSGERSTSTTACGTGCTITGSEQTDAFATLRARAGIAFDSVLVYGTAGGAWMNGSANVNASAAGGSVGVNLSGSKMGWTAGGGVEVALMSNWTAKLEYLYIDTGSLSSTATIPASLGGPGTITETAALRDSVFRIGFNYRFPVTPWLAATKY